MYGKCRRSGNLANKLFVSLSLTDTWGKERCAKWIPHMINNDHHAMCVLLLSTTNFGHCQRESVQSLITF